MTTFWISKVNGIIFVCDAISSFHAKNKINEYLREKLKIDITINEGDIEKLKPGIRCFGSRK